MSPSMFRFGLASAPFPKSVEHGLEYVEFFLKMAAEQNAQLVCFPESYIPGMRGIDEPVPAHSRDALESALAYARELARRWRIALILPMDRDHHGRIQNVAEVISSDGELMGYQTKNQLDPIEDSIFVPGNTRQIFEVSGVQFGISICHEGFRYPETVRWAAARGAAIVFHPHCTGSNKTGTRPHEWRGPGNAYYEHAMMCRAMENEIYFASTNYAFSFPELATCVVSPEGACISHQPYGEAGLLVTEIEPGSASRRLALRYNASACDLSP